MSNDFKAKKELEKFFDRDGGVSKNISLVDMNQFYQLINFLNETKELFLFRGQKKWEWKLESSWLREKISVYGNPEDYRENILVFNDYVQKIKLNNSYKNLSTLQILASLQHSKDVSTPLIDFTDDVLLAFWFALTSNTSNCDASLFILKTDTNSIKKERDMQDFNDESLGYVFESPNISQRALSQRSYFIVDSKDWEKEKNILKVKINKDIIKEIKNYLRSKNKNHKSVYPDLKGEYMNAVDSAEGTYFLHGFVNLRNKKFEKAIKWFEKVLILDPNNFVTYSNMGIAYFEKSSQDYEKAIYFLSKAIKLNSNVSWSYYHRGLAYVKWSRKNYEAAIKDFTKAIELDSKFAQAYTNRGFAHGKKKTPNYKAAIMDLEKAKELGIEYLDEYIVEFKSKIKK